MRTLLVLALLASNAHAAFLYSKVGNSPVTPPSAPTSGEWYPVDLTWAGQFPSTAQPRLASTKSGGTFNPNAAGQGNFAVASSINGWRFWATTEVATVGTYLPNFCGVQYAFFTLDLSGHSSADPLAVTIGDFAPNHPGGVLGSLPVTIGGVAGSVAAVIIPEPVGWALAVLACVLVLSPHPTHPRVPSSASTDAEGTQRP